MKVGLIILSLVTCCPTIFANERGELIFSDNFERNESQETMDQPGNGWNTNSKSRAKGDKQVDLKDGAMHIFISPNADHAVSVTHPAEFTDGSISLRFKLEDPKDSLGLNFADLQYKPVHAGHLFVVRVLPHQVQIQDLKTGNMDLKVRDARQANRLTPEQKQMLETKLQKTNHKIATGQWHELVVDVKGSEVKTTIDGTQVATFTSEAFAHPTKRMLRLAVPRNAIVDDVKIYRLK